MNDRDRKKVIRLCQEIVKIVKRPDIVMLIVTDNDDTDDGDNTRVFSNLADNTDAIRFIGEIARQSGAYFIKN
jgi:hypothetical protein